MTSRNVRRSSSPVGRGTLFREAGLRFEPRAPTHRAEAWRVGSKQDQACTLAQTLVLGVLPGVKHPVGRLAHLEQLLAIRSTSASSSNGRRQAAFAAWSAAATYRQHAVAVHRVCIGRLLEVRGDKVAAGYWALFGPQPRH